MFDMVGLQPSRRYTVCINYARSLSILFEVDTYGLLHVWHRHTQEHKLIRIDFRSTCFHLSKTIIKFLLSFDNSTSLRFTPGKQMSKLHNAKIKVYYSLDNVIIECHLFPFPHAFALLSWSHSETCTPVKHLLIFVTKS